MIELLIKSENKIEDESPRFRSAFKRRNDDGLDSFILSISSVITIKAALKKQERSKELHGVLRTIIIMQREQAQSIALTVLETGKRNSTSQCRGMASLIGCDAANGNSEQI